MLSLGLKQCSLIVGETNSLHLPRVQQIKFDPLKVHKGIGKRSCNIALANESDFNVQVF
jgi:hypothetical protein